MASTVYGAGGGPVFRRVRRVFSRAPAAERGFRLRIPGVFFRGVSESPGMLPQSALCGIEAVFRPVFFVHEGEPCRAQSQAWQQPQQQQVTAREPRERRVILADIAAAEE